MEHPVGGDEPPIPPPSADSGTGATIDDLNSGTFTDLALLDSGTALEWRIEVTNNGRNWNWRKGSGANRSGRYGGTFGQLSIERQHEYERNKSIYAERRAAKKETTGTATPKQGGRLEHSEDGDRGMPAGGRDSGTIPKRGGVTPAA